MRVTKKARRSRFDVLMRFISLFSYRVRNNNDAVVRLVIASCLSVDASKVLIGLSVAVLIHIGHVELSTCNIVRTDGYAIRSNTNPRTLSANRRDISHEQLFLYVI